MAEQHDPCANCRRTARDALPSERFAKCSRCGNAWYCGKNCQKTHWPAHKPICKRIGADEAWVLEIKTNDAWKAALGRRTSDGAGETADIAERFTYKVVKTSHAVFSRGDPCPVPNIVGVPLVIFSPTINGGSMPEMNDDGNNQVAVYLRIEASNCFAPFNWQLNNPGTCILARRDKKAITREVAETVFAYTQMLIDSVGYPEDDGWAPIRELITPGVFQLFSRDYYEKQREKGRLGFERFWSPL